MRAMRYTARQVRANPVKRTWRPNPGADPGFSWGAQRDPSGCPYSPAELEALQKLVARSWFKRLWTRQEVTLAKSAVVVAGDDTIPWPDLISAGFFIDSLVRLRGRGDASFGRDLFNLYELGCLGSYRGLMEILHACRACDCSEDIDRVYGILGLLSSHTQRIVIRPDYTKPAKSAYQDLVLELYRCSERLDILSLCEAAESPSWVPDLNNLNLNTGVNTRVVPYCRASGESAAWLRSSSADTIEIYGVRCGVLGARVANTPLPPQARTSGVGALKRATVKILTDHLGECVAQWDRGRLETLAKGLLGSIWHERTGRQNHSSLAFATSELTRWALAAPSGLVDDMHESDESRDLFNHVTRVLFHGDACRLIKDQDHGCPGLGFSGCREGDVLYAVLGCRRLIALRKEPDRDRYRVIGKFDHPYYNDGQALLGKLGGGWRASYRHGLFASNRPVFEHEDGTSQWHDPRLQGVALPDGWHEGRDPDGCPFWFKAGQEDNHSDSDPRLTCDELRKRGVQVELLVIV